MSTEEAASLPPQIIVRRVEGLKGINEMQINSQGAKIVNLSLEGHPIFITVLRGDGKSASTHPCSPNFGPDTKGFGLPQHGPARNERWTLVKGSDLGVSMESAIEGGTYPKGLVVRQDYILSQDGFTLETKHTNNGSEQLPVNFGEHFYWNAPQGFDELTINGRNAADIFRDPAGGLIQLEPSNRIQIPGVGSIRLDQEKLPFAYLWIGRGSNKDIDRGYVCIEPIEGDPKSFFGSAESMLKIGESRTSRISLKLDV